MEQHGNYNYKDINLVDIWDYERIEFLEHKSSYELAEKVYSLLHNLVVTKGRPSFTYNHQSEDSKFRSYYLKKLNPSLNFTLEQKYLEAYFFFKDDCYEFNQDIFPGRKHEDFDIFFFLKLRQYKDKLTLLPDFLKYQYQVSFSEDSSNFKPFVSSIIRQYGEQLSPGLIETVSEFLNDFVPDTIENTENRTEVADKGIPSKTQTKSPSPKSQNSKHTFALKAWVNDKEFFIKNTDHVLGVLKQLKENDFVAKETSFDQFKYLLSNNISIRSQKIIWVGSNYELTGFIKTLIELDLIEDPKNDKYINACGAFLDRNKNPYEIPQLRNASGRNKVRMEQLLNILVGLQTSSNSNPRSFM